MVSTLDELRTACGLLVDAADEVGCPANSPRPASKSVPWSRCRRSRSTPAGIPLVDFVSIGTNDLTQYTLAAERGNATVASLADPLDLAVLRLISEVATAATACPVAVCGEVAADPRCRRPARRTRCARAQHVATRHSGRQTRRAVAVSQQGAAAGDPGATARPRRQRPRAAQRLDVTVTAVGSVRRRRGRAKSAAGDR